MADPGVLAFAVRHYGVDPEALRVDVVPIRGGLCSTVARAGVRFVDPGHTPRTGAFVVKTVSGREMREIAAYESVVSRFNLTLGPMLLATESIDDASARLFLEWVQSWRRWPWADETLIASVVEQLALLHGAAAERDFSPALRDWDFESELQRSGEDTLNYFETVLTDPQHATLKRILAPLRRVVASLGRLRRALLGAGTTVIHGDAHPGNVIVRLNGRRKQAVLLDWARVRLGSPLEDVSSWLQSLGFWEDEAHRRHDTLLRRYLSARGYSGPLGTEVRDVYAVARASNALAGAMKYHLVNMTDPGRPEWVRAQAEAYVRDWGRGIVRAAACSRG